MLEKSKFIFVKYNGVSYPEGFESELSEVAGHFDKIEIESAPAYSLHTEYSYGKRNLNTNLISKLPALCASNKDGVPQLWKSVVWAEEFAEFILALTAHNNPPDIIEIHPPFNDYCTMDMFGDVFQVFEEKIHRIYPNVEIVIENRSGSVYRGGRFLVGKAKEIAELAEHIRTRNLRLGIVLDFPQLLTAENIDPFKFKNEKYLSAIEALFPYRELIRGIHIWGKKKSESGRWVSHCGDFNTYFSGDNNTKKLFISGIERICDDNKKRFLVPEVNSGMSDLAAIMKDLFEN